MKTAYIFHDAFCDPNTDWYPWMRTILEQQGYFVVAPKFPTPAGQSYDSWKAVIKSYLDKFDNETIFIGHGIGGTFALRILEESSIQIHGLFLVASYTEALGHVGYDRVNETFIKHKFDWQKIKNNVLTIKLFAGESDPFVPGDLTNNLATSLETEINTIPQGGHINKASGFTQCVPLAQGIKEGLGEIDKSIVIDSSVSLDDSRASSSWQEEQPAPVTLESSSPSYQEGDAEGRGSLEKKTGSEATTNSTLGSHTMYQDMTKLVNSNEGKVAASLLGKAHADDAEKKVNEPLTPTNGIYIAGTLAVFLIVLGIGLSLITKYLPAQRNSPVASIPSLLQSEAHTNINISSKQSYEVSQAIATALVQAPQPGSITDVYYTRGNLRASFTDVLESLDLGDDTPTTLAGEFIPAGITDKPVFMHVFTSLNGTPAHALILPISHYDKAFSGFKDWEPTLFRDLGVFMNVPSAFLKTKMTKDVFHDEMVANKNIRVLRYKKPAEIIMEKPVVPVTPAPAQPLTPTPDAATAANTPSTETIPLPNFISEGIQTIQENIPAPALVSPYKENDLMLGYFFLNDRTLIIVDNLALIPELLTRYANSQIYK